jgi:hypothetical protein
MKRFVLIVGLVVAFLVGYGISAKAYPGGGIYGRGEYNGYFTNSHDTSGWEVLNQYCNNNYGSFSYNNGTSNCNAIPLSVNSAASFIAFIEDRLANGAPGGTYGDTRARTGAAFIVQTMIGSSRNRPPTAAEMNTWRDLVNQYGAGHVNWNTSAYTFNINTYFQGTDNSPSPNDDAFYDHFSRGAAIIFYNDSGVPVYALRRECANPVGNGNVTPLPPRSNFSVTGRTVVSVAQAMPGGTATFWHYVRNNGPTSAPSEWWAAFDGPSSRPTGLGGPGSGPMNLSPGEERYVHGETLTIPANAPGGSRYCRLVGWDPVNSAGARDGRGTEACVTVFIPAKLKAAMAVNPASAVNGDTVTFTGSISTLTSGNPVTVNCSISRVVTPPSGAPSNLGNQPCVDNNGNPNIVVPTGGSVTLRPNTYTVADSVPVGARVCDTINITSPPEAMYFNTPADRTATACTVVAKTPYVRFMGNDVFAGGNFAAVNAACNTQAKITTVGRTLQDGSTAGSVGEYGVFALNRITSFGSSSKVLVGSGALGGAGRALTFANSEPDATRLGYFGAAQHCITDYVAQFSSSPGMGPVTINVASWLTGAWHVTGTLNISGTMPAGDQTGGMQAYYVDGDVTISNDIKYPNNYASINKIPSLLIITKGNIYVAPGVKQMDGIFIARGNGTTSGVFYTCWPKNEPASIANQCNNNQLVVNGSVSAGRIDLFRSFGATGAVSAARKDPGEIFNFSPEMYMRNVINTHGQNGQTTVQTTTTLELPPRF